MDKYYRLGLIGKPLSHSLSPRIHGAFLKQFNLQGQYDLLECDDPRAQISAAYDAGYAGLNVTIPHKVTACGIVGRIDEEAKLAGAVNTIVFNSGGVCGYNTDIAGLKRTFTHSLENSSLQNTPKKHALVLGAGGAARASLVVLNRFDYDGAVIVVRDVHKAATMLRELAKAGIDAAFIQSCRVLHMDELFNNLDAPRHCSIFINATPMGQKPPAPGEDALPFWLTPVLQSVAPDTPVLDLVYKQGGRTPLIELAHKVGLRNLADGREMLVEQARQAFRLWTEMVPSYKLGFDTLENALK